MSQKESPIYVNMKKTRLLNKICVFIPLILLLTGCMGTYYQYYDRNSVLTITNIDSSVNYGRLVDITRKDSAIYYSFTADRMKHTRNYNKAKAEILMYTYHYKLGCLDGEQLSFSPIGDTLMSQNYKKDKLDGPLIYYKNGNRESYYLMRQDKKEGTSLHYYPNGTIAQIVNWKNNYENGKTTFYYDNSVLKCDGYYNYGVKDSTWCFYDTLGNCIKVEKWSKGVLVP